MTQLFFDGFHRRLPIVDQHLYRKRWAAAEPSAAPNLILLTLSMALLSRPLVDGDGNPDRVRECLYKTVKYLFLTCGQNKPLRLAAMQCGCFLAMYEYGEGMMNAAERTVAGCVVMVRLIGGYTNRILSPQGGELPSAQNERMLTSWGILVLERSVSASARIDTTSVLTNFLIIRVICTKGEKRLKSHAPVSDIAAILAPLNGSASSNQLAADEHTISLFRQLKSALLLERILDLATNLPGLRERFSAIDCELLKFINHIFDQETRRVGSCCEAMAISIS
jgi:hypothetical protein